MLNKLSNINVYVIISCIIRECLIVGASSAFQAGEQFKSQQETTILFAITLLICFLSLSFIAQPLESSSSLLALCLHNLINDATGCSSILGPDASRLD